MSLLNKLRSKKKKDCANSFFFNWIETRSQINPCYPLPPLSLELTAVMASVRIMNGYKPYNAMAMRCFISISFVYGFVLASQM